MPELSPTTCSNCSETLPAGARYCPACGQSLIELSRPWTELARELLEELFDFDGRMFISMKLLLTRPGFLAHEYIRGRRRTYTPPLRMYLVVSLVFFFVLPSIILDAPGQAPEHRVSVELYSKGMFVLLPVFALILKMFYRRAFYLSHLVFTTYLFSFMYILFGALMALEPAADQYLVIMLFQVVLLLWMLYYFFSSLQTCFDGKLGMTMLKGLSLLLLFSSILAMAIEGASHLG